MSAHAFIGQFVNLNACRCSDSQVLSALNNNLVNFFEWFEENGGVAIDNSINSWADLQAIPTAGLTVPVLKLWVDDSTGLFKATQLRTGTDATDTANGVARPDDYNGATNTKVWYQS